MKTNRSGFTIVELLVVIVVIAILATISIVVYSGIQARARDSKRKNDLDYIAKALENNYLIHGAYTQPETMCADTSNGEQNNTCTYYGTYGNYSDWAPVSNLRALITDKFITQLPKDPVNDTTYYYNYEPWNAGQGGYTTAGQAYDLCAKLEAGGTYCINGRK